MKKTANTLPPPEELDGEALLEWHRIVSDLQEAGLSATTDRALLTIYCQTWQANQSVAKHVSQHGAIVKYNNQVIGQSPHYKTMKETSLVLAKMLDQLGLTPASRRFKKDNEEQPEIAF